VTGPLSSLVPPASFVRGKEKQGAPRRQFRCMAIRPRIGGCQKKKKGKSKLSPDPSQGGKGRIREEEGGKGKGRVPSAEFIISTTTPKKTGDRGATPLFSHSVLPGGGGEERTLEKRGKEPSISASSNPISAEQKKGTHKEKGGKKKRELSPTSSQDLAMRNPFGEGKKRKKKKPSQKAGRGQF